jgi:hypothetical protein
MMNDDTYFGQVRHWLVSNISANPDGSLTLPSSSSISPYIPPSPLPNYMYARPHRYVFIVARGSGHVEITADDLRELQKPYVAAMAGKQEVQDIKDRWGFNAQNLVEMKGLKIEAVNFMRVDGTAKSGVETTGMMAQAMVNKVRITVQVIVCCDHLLISMVDRLLANRLMLLNLVMYATPVCQPKSRRCERHESSQMASSSRRVGNLHHHLKASVASTMHPTASF